MNLWSEFLGGYSWENILQKFCQLGQFREARLLWCRYPNVLEGWIKESGKLERLLAQIGVAFHGDSLQCRCLNDICDSLNFAGLVERGRNIGY